MIRILSIALINLVILIPVSAQKHTIFGTIRDIENGEQLIGATIMTSGKNLGTYSNNFGFYSLTLPEGSINISYSFVGYKTVSHEIELARDTTLDIGLEPEIISLDEVMIEAKDNSAVFINQMGVQSINLKTIKMAPAAAGEIDPIKNLQLLPGIQATNEGTANLSVRVRRQTLFNY